MTEQTPSAAVNVSDWLAPERGALVELLRELDDEAWYAPTECPAWNVHGVALHVLGDDLSLLARQRDAVTNGLVLYAATHPGLGFRRLLDGFNEQWVAAATFLSPRLTIELLENTGEWTGTYYTTIDPDVIGEPVGFFGQRSGSPYWQIIGREYVERWVHQHQIRRALDRPSLDATYLRPACEVIVRAITASMPGLGAQPGQSITLDIATVGSWTLQLDTERWSLVADGAAERRGLTLAIEPDEAVSVFSRGRQPVDVPSAFDVSGDLDLASALTSWLAPALGRP
jgi:uncharacterized protein (TIGR03083 family)